MCVSLAMSGAVFSAEVYKWTDSHGRVHFGDRPPADAQAEAVHLRINTYESPSIETYGVPGAAGGKVVMYSTAWCTVCKQARNYFNENGISFTEYDIEKDEGAGREFRKLGARGVPVILVGSSRMNGFSPQAFLRLYGRPR